MEEEMFEIENQKVITEEDVEKLVEGLESESTNDYWKEHTLREHIYLNENGDKYMQILKTDSPTTPFIPRRYEDNKWKTGTKGLTYIPYKLPELKKAVKENKVIFITNGEKEADTLEELGFVATTAPFMIPTKWNSTCNQYVKGATVVVIKELSDYGKEFADTTMRRLSYSARTSICLSLEKVCKILNIEGNEKTDITSIRNKLKNDEELINLLHSVENLAKKRKEGVAQ